MPSDNVHSTEITSGSGLNGRARFFMRRPDARGANVERLRSVGVEKGRHDAGVVRDPGQGFGAGDGVLRGGVRHHDHPRGHWRRAAQVPPSRDGGDRPGRTMDSLAAGHRRLLRCRRRPAGVLDRVVANGGTVVEPKQPVAATPGYWARFRDTEGNLIGVLSPH